MAERRPRADPRLRRPLVPRGRPARGHRRTRERGGPFLADRRVEPRVAPGARRPEPPGGTTPGPRGRPAPGQGAPAARLALSATCSKPATSAISSARSNGSPGSPPKSAGAASPRCARPWSSTRTSTDDSPRRSRRTWDAPSSYVCRSIPPCLGGMAVEIGDTVIDGSVRHRLDQLREILVPSTRFPGPRDPTMTVFPRRRRGQRTPTDA